MQSVKSDLQSIFHQYDDIQELFFQGDVSSFDINARDSHGKTLLHHACKYGLTEGVSLLLANDAQADIRDKKGYTPLHYACQKNYIIHYDICKILIQRDPYLTLLLTQGASGSRSGSTVAIGTSRDECNRTILHYACIHGDCDIVDNLLKVGADPRAQDKFGNSPMHYACEKGHLQCVRHLIATSQNPNGLLQIPNNGGVKPLSMKTPSGGTILHIACESCDVYVAAKLLEAGADSNLSDMSGFTPLSVISGSGGTILHVACDKGDINLVKKLLKAGADPNVADVLGFTPLMRAVVSTSKSGISSDLVYSIITALCNSKCSVNAAFVPSKPSYSNVSYYEGSTALHMAIDGWRVDHLCVQALVDNGAVLDVKNVHGRTPLHIASMRGHHHLIELLSPSPEFFHFEDNDGCTPLHYACKNSHFECIRKIIFQAPYVCGDLVNVSNKDGTTPLFVRTGSGGTILHAACDKGDINLVNMLLEAGADPNVPDMFGFTPLMRVVVSTSKSGITTDLIHSIITALCNSKCNCNVNAAFVPAKPSDTNAHYYEGSTALHMAIDGWTDNQLCVQALVDNGAALDARDVHGRTPLHFACLFGYQYVIGLLDLNQMSFLCIKDNDGCTPLYYACMNSHLKFIQAFIVQCPDIARDSMKIANNDGTTPLSVRTGSGGAILHVACDIRNINLVMKLLEAGANPNEPDEFGFTPLMRAVLNPDVSDGNVSSLVTVLCNSNGHVNSTFLPCESSNKYMQWKGTTALFMAVDQMECSFLCVKALIDNGATVDVTDTHGCTPLHIASFREHFRLFKLLAPSPESFYFKDNDGCTPLYYACKNSHLECIREFMVQIPDDICYLMKIPNKYGASPLSVRGDNDQTILHVACMRGDLSIVKKVLEAGADPNSVDGSTFTPLMLAVQHVDDVKAADIVAVLCDFKCKINIQTSYFSVTALHLASELGKKKCVEMLVAKGANLLVQTQDGTTPLHLACKGGYHTLVCSLITEETLKAYDYKHWTPLHYACECNHFECARRIVVGFSKLLQIQERYPGYHLPIPPFHGLKNQYGKTILHHAFMRNDVQFVENLLTLGADPNVQDNDGATPLMSALQCHGSDADTNLLSLLLPPDWKPDIKDNSGCTALHYSAMCDDIQIPLMLISAGCDVTVVDNYGQTFSDLISKKSLQLINKQLLRIDRRQIICVVGYPKCGKTTIIAAFQQAQQNRGTFERFTARLKFNTRVTLDESRTAGIDTKVITTRRLGSLIFFDFAGQSEYYASHLAFLQSALSAKGSTITFIMMVDLRCSEEDRIAQCKEWLFPMKSILKDHNMLNVILIGSHLDQVKSVSISTSSLQDILRELKRALDTPQMQFIDCWGMDCRQLSSKGMTNLQHYLQSIHPAASTSAEANQVPLGACLLFDRLKKSENPSLAITPSKIIDNLKDGHAPFPLTVKYIDSCCQDLAASGLVLYIPNREDAGDSWLILEMEEILSHIHGKLFAPDSAEFPMHHKTLANQFGLVHVEELSLAFKNSSLDPEMVQKLLMAMEFCHPVDSTLMTEGILDGFFSKVSHDLHENLLFFPSLVKANEEPLVPSMESDIQGDDCHWVCWELSTVKPHFLHPRFQQAVFFQLACNHVQKHKSDLSTVEEHSFTVSKNAMSWSTIHGVDVRVQIMHKSTIKVLARSRPGVKVSSLMEMFSSVVSDVLTVRANHAPGVDAYSVFNVMEKGTPGEHTVPVSSIIDVVQAGGMYVNSREHPPKLVSLKDLFLDWDISVTLLEKMVSISNINHNPPATAEDVSGDTRSGPVMIDGRFHESEHHFPFIFPFMMYFIIYLILLDYDYFSFLCPSSDLDVVNC